MPTQTATIRGVDITAYLVQDAERAKKFYTDTLGLKMTMDYGPNGGEFTFPDGTTFGIYQPPGGDLPLGGGIMFAVPDAKKAVEHYRSRGVELSDVMESPVCLMSFGSDPEGNRFMIHQRKSKD